jgi:hypothetical protein
MSTLTVFHSKLLFGHLIDECSLILNPAHEVQLFVNLRHRNYLVPYSSNHAALQLLIINSKGLPGIAAPNFILVGAPEIPALSQ